MTKTVYLYYSSSIAVEVEDCENMSEAEIIESAREMVDMGSVYDNLVEAEEEAYVED